MVRYEWDVETVEDVMDGDVLDHAYVARYADAMAWCAAWPADDGSHLAIVLVRDDDKGRQWAYVVNGKLPEYFSDASGADGSKVPAKFREECCHHCHLSCYT